jgi:hypothetical protein
MRAPADTSFFQRRFARLIDRWPRSHEATKKRFLFHRFFFVRSSCLRDFVVAFRGLSLFTAVAVRHFIAATAFVALTAYAVLYGRVDGKMPIQSDGYSYYVYLPSWFIYKDISLEALANDWYGGTYPSFTGLRRWPSTGRWMNLHPIGTAILEAPFFGAADVLSRWSNLPRDGFSLYYEHAAGLAGLAYFVGGLAVLRRILMRHFSNGVVLATLACITWGTNLFHYGVFDATFSHAFAFFEICVWLWLVEAWWDRATPMRSLMLGLAAALIVVTRHTNAIVLLMLPLFGVASRSVSEKQEHAPSRPASPAENNHHSKIAARVARLPGARSALVGRAPGRDVRLRVGMMWDRRRMLAIAGAAAAVAVFPQLALYRWTTGSWLVNAYDTHAGTVGFRFGSPHVFDVLFSTQKGLFFWSPVLLLAVAGMVIGRGWVRNLRPAAVVVLGTQTYLIASWSEWQFGASYGHRAFTDALGLTAPFLAAFFERVAARPLACRFVAAGATAAVLLSIAQMIQYWIGILPYADTTWAQYRTLFLRFQ